MDAEVQLIQAIVTNLLRRGTGDERNPIRIIRQVWTTDGQFIAEYDPCPSNPSVTAEDAGKGWEP